MLFTFLCTVLILLCNCFKSCNKLVRLFPHHRAVGEDLQHQSNNHSMLMLVQWGELWRRVWKRRSSRWWRPTRTECDCVVIVGRKSCFVFDFCLSVLWMGVGERTDCLPACLQMALSVNFKLSRPTSFTLQTWCGRVTQVSRCFASLVCILLQVLHFLGGEGGSLLFFFLWILFKFSQS